ncbi:putative SNF2 family N-terminal domain containing protein [Lyophyllum shimeji]|uniref:SNF2 family N-terminal domain containing protein n=1 Tax=Lyophyllum shimeji TaxID=47721 RepID=A0A9P3PZY8_LYOSH|nr:putative SNF2 family N-terminal domain containing protein [Lyophyllum shimeji]
MSPVQKKSAYAKRNTASIPAPLPDPDSDSDFAPGAYVPEPAKKRKRTGAVASTSSGVLRRRKRSDVLGAGRSSTKRQRVALRRPFDPEEHNPLLPYFAEENLDLQSESEGEDDEMNEPHELDEEDEEDEDEKDDEEDQPIVLKSLVGFVPNSKPHSTSPSPVVKNGKTALADADDSATEPESETEVDFSKIPVTVSQRRCPSKQVDVEKSADESVTEPESDDENDVEPILVPTTRPPSSDSETESDSEYELGDPRLGPRPGFPLAPGQVPAGPLVLDSDKKIAVSASINTYLRDYQRDGVHFFWRQYSEGRGGLLGDDMGLDLPAWKERRELPPADATWPTCLIIAPSTVVHNWQREFETWGYFEVGVYNGSRKEREPVLQDFKMGRLDVVLTTFDLARRDIDILDSLPWTCIFVDEVHRVKNVSAKITVAYHQFRCNRRFGLTGTTIQNSYKEMWTILDWTNPGRLGTARQWQGFVVKPLTAGQSAGATEDERAKALVVALVLKNKLLPKFFLRRTKDIIRKQLPKKTDEVVFCPLTPQQTSVYKHILNMTPVQNLIHRDDPCFCGSCKSRKNCCGPSVPGDVFKYMSILIKLSNHLALILPSPTDTPEQIVRNRALAELAFPDGDIPKYGTAMMQPKFCGKWAVLEHLLLEWRKDPTNKVLIFTKSVKLLEMLEFHLKSRGYGFLKLDGSTKQADRMPMIDKFHSDPNVFLFLISTLAGGTGLNLTGANKVVIFDPNWNPAHDLQAMDRAFRFGQTRDVSVYRLLGAGSVEELIYARQIYKQQQMAIGYDASVQTRYFEGVQGDTAKKGELFGIENIFKLHEDKLATKMAIEKANLAELDWALAHMGGSRRRRQNKGTAEDWVAEAEVKGSKDKEDVGNLRGLSALLFDDAPLDVESSEQDAIQRTLNAIGVKYSHYNDEVLVPSRIEEERTKKTLQSRRRKSKQKAGTPEQGAPKPQWPPIRKHHKPPLAPEEQLASRHQALIELGMISNPSDVPTFARDFARQPPEMQKEIIAELDKWTRIRDLDSD